MALLRPLDVAPAGDDVARTGLAEWQSLHRYVEWYSVFPRAASRRA
ncbi:MAG: hypothetical protein ABI316_08840 [Casimicrobiaceae bacterium]